MRGYEQDIEQDISEEQINSVFEEMLESNDTVDHSIDAETDTFNGLVQGSEDDTDRKVHFQEPDRF